MYVIYDSDLRSDFSNKFVTFLHDVSFVTTTNFGLGCHLF